MLSAEIVVKKLSRAAVANDGNYRFFTAHLNKRLKVHTIDFDERPIETEHGIFHVVVKDDLGYVHILFLYRNDTAVDFELYLGGNRIWPKQ